MAAVAAQAAGSIIGGVIQGKGAKKAAKIQAKAAAQQTAALERQRAQLTAMYQPTIDRGNNAGTLISQFLGAEGGDQAASALNTYRNSTGYQDLLNSGLGAVNANAYARGMGASGATLKALQTKGMALADQSSGSWLNGLQYLNNAGSGGMSAIAGISQNTTNAINGANQNAADARSNSALVTANGWTQALQGAANAAGSLGSSYGSGAGSLSNAGSLAGQIRFGANNALNSLPIGNSYSRGW